MSVQDSCKLPKTAEVVIVGAGVAGLYSAYRLLSEGKAKDLVIIERLNRIGGRLDTDLIQVKGADGEVKTVRDEEGGMRFNYGMDQLMALNGALNLCDKIVPFPMGPTKPGFDLYYFIRSNQFLNGNDAKWSQLYNLSQNEQGKSPGTILGEIFQTLLDANAGIMEWPSIPTPEDWQILRLKFEWNGIPLNEWQLWGLVRDLDYSEECVTMLSHALGFEGPFLSLANAGEAFQILEDFPEPDFYTFRFGYSTLIKALRKAVCDLGAKIFVGVNVDKIASGCNLDVTVAPAGQSSSRFVDGGVRSSISAPKVILAVASKALADLYASSSVLHDAPNAQQISQDIESVVNMRLLKINLYFAESWWEDETKINPPVQYGPSFTDLPINSIYPFYSLVGPANEQNPAALTIYCDFNNTNFWQGLQNVGPAFDSPLQQQHSKTPQVIFPASVAIVDEAVKQIKQLFGVTEIPNPVMTSYRLWGGESDFGFAYHQWALNADDANVMKRMVELVPNFYTCNEAYSDDQGWVNGSLRSADRMLEKFGIDPLPMSSACKAPSG
jgi:hypothetical protein